MDLPVEVNVSTTGAAQIVDAVPAEFQDDVRRALSGSLVNIFYISLALSCVSMIGALGTRWGSMKGVNGQEEKPPPTVDVTGSECSRES